MRRELIGFGALWPRLLFVLWVSLATPFCALKPVMVYLDEPLPASLEVLRITSVTAEERGEVIRIAVRASQPFSYNIFEHSAPLGLSLVIPGAELHQDLPQELTVAKGPVTAIRLRPAGGTEKKAEVMIGLDRETAHSVQEQGSVLFVDVENPKRPASVASSSPVAAPPREDADRPLPSDARDYRIGGGDVLQIRVYDEPDLEKTVRVSSGGLISFPLIGEVQVAGLTAAQVEWTLQDLLGKGYLVNPQVSVLVAEYHSQEVFILGAVERPGAYPLTRRSNLLEMLSRAGGIAAGSEAARAGRELIVLRPILHRGKGGDEGVEEVQHIRIDLQRLLSEGDGSLNLPVQGKDTLYVPLADSVFVFGEVKNPGAQKILEKDITLLEAITMAGGFTEVAAPGRTTVVRMENGVERTLLVNVDDIIKRGDKSKDIRLQGGDLVVVPESFF